MEQISREEMEALLEKAKKDLQATLDKMTPEEREQAEIKAKKMTEEDRIANQKLLDDAAAILARSSQKQAPKFCGNCGAPASGGKFCTCCGSPL